MHVSLGALHPLCTQTYGRQHFDSRHPDSTPSTLFFPCNCTAARFLGPAAAPLSPLLKPQTASSAAAGCQEETRPAGAGAAPCEKGPGLKQSCQDSWRVPHAVLTTPSCGTELLDLLAEPQAERRQNSTRCLGMGRQCAADIQDKQTGLGNWQITSWLQLTPLVLDHLAILALHVCGRCFRCTFGSCMTLLTNFARLSMDLHWVSAAWLAWE